MIYSLSTRFKLQIARILFYMVKPFAGTKKRIISRGGLQFEVDITEGIDLSLFLFGNFQKHVSENKFVNLPDDAVVFDVGANVGIMTLNFARKAPRGKVYAFEPTHYAFEKLHKNISLNQRFFPVINSVNTFISSQGKKAGDIKAFSSWKIDKKVGPNQHQVHGGTVMSAEGVPTITLDDFVRDQKIERIDFIKIDTDGHEFDVLVGAEQCINKLKPTIIFELGLYIMKEREITFMDYFELFKKLNYTLSDASNNKLITDKNYKKMIPTKGTIDVLAISDQ